MSFQAYEKPHKIDTLIISLCEISPFGRNDKTIRSLFRFSSVLLDASAVKAGKSDLEIKKATKQG